MRTVLFGLDGATYTILDDLMARGVMPHLARICQEGVRGTLGSTPLPLTPEAWTSLATGRSPGHHGIGDWVRYEWGPRGNYGHINDSRDNLCETIWEYASRSGRQVTVLNYYGLAPPRPIRGHSMPGFTSGRHLRRSSVPRDLFSRLEAVEGFDVKVLGLDLEIERQVLQEMDRELWPEWLAHHIERDRVWFGVMDHLMTHEPSDLTAIVFDGVDKLQHLAYRYLDPALAPADPDPWERQIIGLCHDYFRQIDSFLGRTLERIGVWGRVVVVSDHGFTASREILYINKWLHDRGWLTWKGEQSPDEEEACATPRPENDANAIDLERSRAFAFTPSANGIWIQVPESEYHAFREEIVAGLFSIRGPDGGQIVTEVLKREEAFAGPAMERFPDLTLALRDHGFVSVLNAHEVVRPRTAPFGTHHPHGVLLAAGPGLRRGADVGTWNILDVAPLLLHSLGLEIPADYDGTFPADLYDEAYLASDPPRVAAESASAGDDGAARGAGAAQPAGSAPAGPAAAGTGADASADAVEMDEEEETLLLERLKSLGYIE